MSLTRFVMLVVLVLGSSLASAADTGASSLSKPRDWQGFLLSEDQDLQKAVLTPDSPAESWLTACGVTVPTTALEWQTLLADPAMRPTLDAYVRQKGPQGYMVTPEVAERYYNSLFYSTDPNEKRPVVKDAAKEGKEKADWFDSNRIMVGSLGVSGKGAQTCWLVQGLNGNVRYPVPVAPTNDKGLVNISVEPERPAHTRAEQIEKRDAVFPRWAWVVGVSTSKLSESDVSGADETRAYFLGRAYAINPYMSLVGGVSNESPLAIGFCLDLGIVNFKP